MFFDYPTEQDWAAIEQLFPFRNLFDVEQALRQAWPSDDSIEGFTTSIEIHDWSMHLDHRLRHTYRSYIMLMFYFQKGIPDKEWFISPGKEGQSVEYFHHFEEQHHWYKLQFDYYTDVFYYKLFSSWDTIGHLLNVAYKLGSKRPSFKSSLKALNATAPNLHNRLNNAIVRDSDFVKTCELRHDITHNFLPTHVGSTITKVKTNNTIYVNFGVGSYVTSNEIVENIPKALDLLVNSMQIIISELSPKESM